MDYPIASLALQRLSVAVSEDAKARAIACERRIRNTKFSAAYASELSRMRTLASTTLFQELHTPSSSRIGLAQWEKVNQRVLKFIQLEEQIEASKIDELHSILSKGTKGELRKNFVQGGNTSYPEPDALPELWGKFSEFLNTKNQPTILYAAGLYQWLITAHFYEDANGRLARLCADWALLKAGLIPIVFPDDISSFVSALDTNDPFSPSDAVYLVCEALERTLEIIHGSN